MAQRITLSANALVEAANREIETISVEEALALHGHDDVVFVDIRDIRELNREGRMLGAIHCPRGMLEFWIDPESKYHKPVFAQDKRFIFFAAAAGARPLPRRPRLGWDLSRSPTSKAVMPPGKRQAGRLK